MTNIIAIDGPAGVGKSTIALGIANEFGITHIDTGAIYRTLALCVINSRISLDDHEAIIKLASLLNYIDYSEQIKGESVGYVASIIGNIPEVRSILLFFQRNLIIKYPRGAVVEGRDIGTIVFPDAKYKFFFNASLNIRARRRFNELESAGKSCDYKEILELMRNRDLRDKRRSIAPLRPANDAILVNTGSIAVDKLIKKLVSYIKRHM